MHDRVDALKRLRADPKYQRALSSARTDVERRDIAATVEGFVGTIADVLGPLIERTKRDPEFAQQLGRAISERQNVVTTGPATSGSIE